MVCPNCKNDITEDSKFCPFCGEKLARINTTSTMEVQPIESNSTGHSNITRSGRKIATWIVCILVLILLAGNIYQYYQYADNENQEYSEIQQFVRRHSSEYRVNSSYYTFSNIIAVRKGQTAELGVFYNGNRRMWVDYHASSVDIRWSGETSHNVTHLLVTGKKTGTSELSFTLGDSKKSDGKVVFHVLVVVTD